MPRARLFGGRDFSGFTHSPTLPNYRRTVNLRRIAAAPALALLASTLIFAGAAPSSADPGNAFDVYSIEVGDLRVKSGACRNIPITLRHDASSYVDDIDANVEFWRGSRYVGSEYLYSGSSGSLRGSFFYCPNLDGFGNFKAGPSEVSWSSYDYSDLGNFTDATTGSFKVLQDARVTKLKAKRKGKKVTITGRSSWYSVDASRWLSDPKRWKLKLQRQASGGKWKTVKNFRAGKKGFTVKVTAKKRAKYRVVSAAGRDTWSGVSKTIRK